MCMSNTEVKPGQVWRYSLGEKRHTGDYEIDQRLESDIGWAVSDCISGEKGMFWDSDFGVPGRCTLLRDVEAPAAEVRVGDRFQVTDRPHMVLTVTSVAPPAGCWSHSPIVPDMGGTLRFLLEDGWTRLPRIDDAQGEPWVKDSNGVQVVRLPHLDAKPEVKADVRVPPGAFWMRSRECGTCSVHGKFTLPDCQDCVRPLDANAADVAREEVEKREHAKDCGCYPCAKAYMDTEVKKAQARINGIPFVSKPITVPPIPDYVIAERMEAINAAYQESEAQRREVEAIKERMRPGVGVMNLGAPFVGGWDKRGRR